MTSESAAQNVVVTYQGHLTSGGQPFNGNGRFKFAVVRAGRQASATATVGCVASNSNFCYGYGVIGVTLLDGGSGYTNVPNVSLTGPPSGGSAPTAVAVVSNGVVIAINVTATADAVLPFSSSVTIDPPSGFESAWSNGGMSVAGSEPTTWVAVPVTNGLFTVGLGDTNLANMTVLPAAAFAVAEATLHVWFNDGTNGFAPLNPPQRITTAPRAAYADYANGISAGVGGSVGIPGNLITSGNVGIGAVSGTPLSIRGIGANGEWIALMNTNGATKWHINHALNGMNFVQTGVADYRLFLSTNGNVGIGLPAPTNKLHVAGGVSATAFVSTSDRNAKENLQPVSPLGVLDKVVALPISTWNFKTMNDGRHMGPMAQDFYAAFGLGGGDTTITTIDPDGVALAAIQGLNQKLEKKEAEITELKSRLEKLERRLSKQTEAEAK